MFFSHYHHNLVVQELTSGVESSKQELLTRQVSWQKDYESELKYGHSQADRVMALLSEPLECTLADFVTLSRSTLGTVRAELNFVLKWYGIIIIYSYSFLKNNLLYNVLDNFYFFLQFWAVAFSYLVVVLQFQ